MRQVEREQASKAKKPETIMVPGFLLGNGGTQASSPKSGVEKYRSAVSGRMVTTVLPGPS